MQPTSLDWLDSEEIGYALFEQEPSTNPLTVRFTDLIEKVLQLPAFKGERERCNEKILEAIQMAWLEEYQEEQA
ncbi:MAG: Fe-S cluster assembly protein IscX [Planctomycetes bacterium]|nr:Fe-S cluster assembly protein IscX [Planctomycetota bacterium]